MILDDLKKSLSSQSDDELMDLILETRKSRRTSKRAQKEPKKKIATLPSIDKIDISKLDKKQRAELARLLAEGDEE